MPAHEPRPDVAVFLPDLSAGGAERVMLALLEQFASEGLRCDLVLAQAPGVWRDRVPASVRIFSLNRRKPLYAVLALWAYLRRERPAVLFSSILGANVAALLATRLPGAATRCVVREAGMPDFDVHGESRVRTWINRLALQVLYPRADAIIALTQDSVRGLTAVAPRIPYESIHIIPNPRIRPAMASEAMQSPRGQQCFLHDGASPCPLVLSCGRLEPQKDYATLLDAFARVHRATRARLAILGQGSLRQELVRSAAQLGIADAVEFPGYVSEPAAWMRRADVFVLSSRWEGFPNVLLEALEARCPIVSTDSTSAVRDILDGDRFGCIVPVGDSAALATAIENVLHGKCRFDDSSVHLQRYDLPAIARRYLDVLFDRRAQG